MTGGGVESTYAWVRLGAALLLSTIGGVGMWSVVVALPAVQAEFGVARADASFPYTLTMICFGLSGMVMGRLSDRFGDHRAGDGRGRHRWRWATPSAGAATSLWQYTLAQGLLIGAGSAATFGPLLADTSLWFHRRRGIAVGIFASGNYVAGAIWSPVVQHFIAADGWRHTSFGIAVFCAATMLPLALVLKRPPPAHETAPAQAHLARRTPAALWACRPPRCRRC